PRGIERYAVLREVEATVLEGGAEANTVLPGLGIRQAGQGETGQTSGDMHFHRDFGSGHAGQRTRAEYGKGHDGRPRVESAILCATGNDNAMLRNGVPVAVAAGTRVRLTACRPQPARTA